MNCQNYGFEITSLLKETYCCNCSNRSDCFTTPKFELPKVDVFELAKLLTKKRKWEALPLWAKEGRLGKCPKCHETSLWYNKWAGKFECMNIKCPSKS